LYRPPWTEQAEERHQMKVRSNKSARSFGGIDYGSMLNADADWDQFSPSWYKEHNYAKLGEDDRQIIGYLRDFFGSSGLRRARGLDVGTGSNLYPALGMLPFCREIVLLDYSRSNVKWLKDEVKSPSRTWDQYWAILQSHRAYAGIGGYRELLRKRAWVRRGDLLELDPRRPYDMGTMFFVAESSTSLKAEFSLAVRRFVGALKNDAPFAIAFMVGSKGYSVDGHRYPAVEIDGCDMEECLQDVAKVDCIHETIRRDPPLREGYEGMSLATGWALGARDGGSEDETRTSKKSSRHMARPGRMVLSR
jgi:hypothetical protein